MKAKQVFEFERTGNPKKSLQLGMDAAITTWLNEHYDNPNESEYIYLILNNIFDSDELDPKKAKLWIEYLISNGYSYEECNFSDFYDYDIDFVDSLPVGPIKYIDSNLNLIKKSNDEYIVEFNDWIDFINYFEYKDKTYIEFVETILNGSYFDFWIDHNYNIEDIIEYFKLNINKLSTIDEIKEVYLKLGGTQENTLNIEKLLIDINDNEIFDELNIAIQTAMSDAENVAYEDSINDDIIKTIKDNYNLSEVQWIEKSYQCQISKDGLENLLSSILSGENLIYWKEKDYYIDIDPTTFNDYLFDRLSELM